MRLTEFEQRAIRETVRQFLPNATVYLYGSRVDDTKRGGDIDLMIVDTEPVPREIIRGIRWKLWEVLGEQKIDILGEQEGSLSTFARMVSFDAVPIE
ncbi:MAG TPA: nucleotidyltransferase domain-containing protein [Candidatus Kapabacteria bacterium]|jgi:predicted nucleotidyltransferase|nr:nucleotidyltransferase domain-containing protein [Candidatus Kapabacteria bacterium]